MTFVQVKDLEWLDLERGTALNVLKLVEGGRIDIETISGPLKFTYHFPTLSEALTAAEKIIGSCEPVKSSPFPPLTLADITPKQSY